MNVRWILRITALATFALIAAANAAPLGTAFTYQGQLKQGGTSVTGTVDFQFSLWDAATNGTQVGSTVTLTSVTVENGLFTAALDFGGSAFGGDARWLEISVRSPAGGGEYTTLSPRQELTPAPNAVYAAAAGSATNGITGSGTPGTVPKFLAARTVGDSILRESGGRIGLGVAPAAKLHVGGTPGMDGIMFPDGTLQTTAAGGGFGAWGLRGNAGTNPPTDFLGTTDNKPLELKVNGARAMRFEVTTYGPNVIGGAASNSVDAGMYSSTIGGGENNRVGGVGGFIGGGFYNTASGSSSAVVAGGNNNTASGINSAILGGTQNTAGGTDAAVLGGGANRATGDYASVVGGRYNTASGQDSLACGQRAYAGHKGTLVWADDSSTNTTFASTADNQFLVRAAGGVGINTNAPASALHVAGNTTIVGTVLHSTTGPGNSQVTILTASGLLDANGNFTITIPQSYFYSWQADNFTFKVELFVSLDAGSAYPHANRGSAYQEEIVGKERGDSLTHFTELHKVAYDATFAFTYSATGVDLRIAVDTNRASGIEYRVTARISH